MRARGVVESHSAEYHRFWSAIEMLVNGGSIDFSLPLPRLQWFRIVRALLCCVMFVAGFSLPAKAGNVAVGVNVINPYKLSIAEQDALFDQIAAAGISAVRVSITLNDAGVEMAQRISRHGIGVEALIYRFGGYAPDGRPLSLADAGQFRASFAPIFARIDASRIKLVALELGNEINLAGYNPEFSRPMKGIQYSLQDLRDDPDAQKIAGGFQNYLRVLAVLKDLRDHSQTNRQTPILTAGFAAFEGDEGALPRAAGMGDLVSVNATLQYMRSLGLDQLVDGYAVHTYPPSGGPGNPVAAESRRRKLARYVLSECRPAGSSQGKPCWLTEWGFNDPDTSCPITETGRPLLIAEMMDDLRRYVQQGRLAGLFYFAWNSTPGGRVSPLSIFRCDELTMSGKLATDRRRLQ